LVGRRQGEADGAQQAWPVPPDGRVPREDDRRRDRERPVTSGPVRRPRRAGVAISVAVALWAAPAARAELTFAPAAPATASRGPADLAVGDLNGDGVPDVVTADNGAADGTTVSVFLGRGDGTFAAAAPFAVGTGTHAP